MKLFLFFLILFAIPSQVKSQNNYLKTGIGFYTVYENGTLFYKEINFSSLVGFDFGIGFTWMLGKSAYLTWENSFRYKELRTEFIGMDTTKIRKSISHYQDAQFFNLDSKVLLKFDFLKFEDVKILLIGGTGITINLQYDSDYKTINNNVVLEYNIPTPFWEDEVFFNGYGVLLETGAEINFKRFSVYVNLIMELNYTHLYWVGDTKTIFTSMNFLYNF